MAFAQGSRSILTYVVESTFGTTPGSPTMKTIPINSHTLDLRKAGVESAEIRSDRQVAVYRHGNKSAEGDIEVEFRPDDYDDFLESALFGQFTTAGVLKLGTTFQSMSIEDGALDIDQYRLFTGMAVNSLNLSVQPNQMILATFGMMGKTMTISGSSADASPDAALSDDPFDAFSGTISEGGSPIAVVSGLELTVENNIEPAFVIGSDTTAQMEYGRGRVTGQFTAYFEDAALINKFINETESSLEFELASTVTGDTYTFEIPKIKYSGASVPLNDEQSRLVTLPFIGLYNSSDATSLLITKS